MHQLETLEIVALSNDGRGIAAKSNTAPVTFVAGALPQERVRAQIIAVKKGFREARVCEILESSPHSLAPSCPHAHECGGCPLLRLDYAEQCRWKAHFVSEALRRIAKIEDAPLMPLIPSPKTAHFRNRIELAFGHDESGQIILGMRKRFAHSIIHTSQCQLLQDDAYSIVSGIEEEVNRFDLSVYQSTQATQARKYAPKRRQEELGFLRFCHVRTGLVPTTECLTSAAHVPSQQGIWLSFITSQGSKAQYRAIEQIATRLLERFPQVQGVSHELRFRRDLFALSEQRRFCLGRGENAHLLAMPLLGQSYVIDINDFFQVNTEAAQGLARLANQGMTAKHMLDLYCGSGAPGLSCTHPTSITGLELSASAVSQARVNAQRFGKQGHYIAGDIASTLRSLSTTTATHILCDPPRAGLESNVVQFLCQQKISRLIYISCNPATMARDAKLLHAHFTLKSVTPLDLFPHTPHIENISEWVGKDANYR